MQGSGGKTQEPRTEQRTRRLTATEPGLRLGSRDEGVGTAGGPRGRSGHPWELQAGKAQPLEGAPLPASPSASPSVPPQGSPPPSGRSGARTRGSASSLTRWQNIPMPGAPSRGSRTPCHVGLCADTHLESIPGDNQPPPSKRLSIIKHLSWTVSPRSCAPRKTDARAADRRVGGGRV